MANRRHSLAHPSARMIRGAWQSHLLTASLLLLPTAVGMSPADPQGSRGITPLLNAKLCPFPTWSGLFFRDPYSALDGHPQMFMANPEY